MTHGGDGLLEEMWFFEVIFENRHKCKDEMALQWRVWDETGDIRGGNED